MAFRFLTSGESHGPGLSAIIEGVPAGLEIDLKAIDAQLRRRQSGYGRGDRQKIETDAVTVLSGVRFGRAMGGPITLHVPNRDWANWQDRMAVGPVEAEPEPVARARPGHADYAGMLKYNTNDLRNILERSSARNTVALVAVGAVARAYLAVLGVLVGSHVVNIGGVRSRPSGDTRHVLEIAESSCVRVGDPDAEARIVAAIDEAGARGDTLGGVFEVVALGCPPGIGSFVSWEARLDSRLAGALMGIQAIKGVEIGMGFGVADVPGSAVHDEILPADHVGVVRTRNNAGGIEGGMTNGEPVVVRAAMKPISTMKKPLRSIDMQTREPVEAHFERSDVCAVPAAAVIGEAMVSIVLATAAAEKFGGDSVAELKRNYEGYCKQLAKRGF